VLPSTTVRDHRVLIDSDVIMRSHVSRTVSGCFAVMTAPQHQTLSVRFCVPFTGRVAGYATSRLLQRTLAGLPASQLSRLQSVLNATVRLTHLSMSTSHQ